MAISVFTADSLACGATVAGTATDLGEMGWSRINMVVPSMPSGSLYVWGSSDDSTYYRITSKDTPTSPYLADSSVVANGAIVEIPGGFRYLKPGNSSGVTDAVTTGFEFIVSY